MLVAAVLILQPEAPQTLPTDQGRAIHAWFLDQVRRHDPALAHAIHDDQGPKPFTCSSLQGFRAGRPGAELHLSPDEAGWLRITTLSRPLSTLMVERILPELPETLSLGDAVLRIQAATMDETQHRWAGQTTYAELLQRYTLSTERPDRRIRLRFASPTTFRREDHHLPVPLPDLIVQGWLARWNAFAGVRLPDEVYRYAVECLAISYYELRTEQVHFGPATLIGCVGRCTYHALNADPYWLRLLHALAAYSFYCGTGHKTTQGLGQTRREG